MQTKLTDILKRGLIAKARARFPNTAILPVGDAPSLFDDRCYTIDEGNVVFWYGTEGDDSTHVVIGNLSGYVFFQDWYKVFNVLMGGTLTAETKYRVYWSQGYTPQEAAYEEGEYDWDKED